MTADQTNARREALKAERAANRTPERQAELEAGWAKMDAAKAAREAARKESRANAERWDAESRTSACHTGRTHRGSSPQHGRM